MNLEYRLPNFPEDSYGFTLEDRIKFGNQTRRYLITGLTLDDLRELKFENGDPIYIERELKHLEDVKIVLKGSFIVSGFALLILVAGGIYGRFRDWWEGFLQALSWGGWLTAGLLAVITILSVVSFQSLFVKFHHVFFEGDSWLFLYSDTLIRLFPVRFWQDVFLAFGIITLTGGILLGRLLPWKRR
jgi:integral membrane protein (TIGR01906 family)